MGPLSDDVCQTLGVATLPGPADRSDGSITSTLFDLGKDLLTRLAQAAVQRLCPSGITTACASRSFRFLQQKSRALRPSG